jgi:pyrimidine operon attenuation protein/uracil phosphoribosyltransferase
LSSRSVLDEEDVGRTLRRIAHEIVEKNPDLSGIAVVGIHTRGVVIARRLHDLLLELTGVDVPLGEIDISFYRDDLQTRSADGQPVVHATRLDFPLEERTIIMVDDVLFTGRTVRAGIEALFDYGRPARIQLAVLCDRGHRELPIRPDYVGKNLPTSRHERVSVSLRETDGSEGVSITSPVEVVE